MTENVQADSAEPIDEDARRIDWSKAQKGARLLLEAVGENPDSQALQDTWQRRVPGAFQTLTEGTRIEAKPELQTFEVSGDTFVVKSDIPVYSLCEHHVLPYFGTATVAYRSNGAVVGLSKLVRYVRWQSRKLTMQEDLTQDIATGLAEEIGTETVLVELSATHLCEAMRGVETKTETSTRAVVGDPTESERKRFNEAT
ncbi:GTP cyclohydrolase I [Haloarcula sp. 1CSR25-25]|uniref:GTP cyclohydrolase I n=1 Tax=Haloarcula sp. 1CSR25-25 TaxID=2862545 RepID=UPI00289514A1|nr:GTP cyclohydrolase I [Haloarcula sp. 1CSR25-25]MDT3433253.1 GTP cyclohydrolase I [Haloarcula sp. 1CSR25-25]